LCKQPGSHQKPVVDLLQATFEAMTLAEAGALLDRLDVCWAPVKTFPEALADEQLAARRFVLSDGKGRKHFGSPIRFASEPAQPSLEPPPLDRDRGLLLQRSPA
jgi:crotonobetainyl-CoA:carnitine CoA-transferase CaiB-like acyl-CoA transferase